jgi:molybdate transport system substrate-binding protein
MRTHHEPHRYTETPRMSHVSLKLLSSMATRELLAELTARHQQTAQVRVAAEAAGGVDVAKRVQGGEPVDVVVLASNAIDKLIADGKLTARRVDIVKSGIAMAVRAGAPKPDIGSEAAVREAVLAAGTLSFSTGPSGVYLEKMFAGWGILDSIRSRIVVPPPGIPVGSLVANGSVELGFQQLSELQNLAGIEVLGPLPPAIQSQTIFSGAISPGSRDPAAAQALLDYLAAPATEHIKKQHGMDPV